MGKDAAGGLGQASLEERIDTAAKETEAGEYSDSTKKTRKRAPRRGKDKAVMDPGIRAPKRFLTYEEAAQQQVKPPEKKPRSRGPRIDRGVRGNRGSSAGGSVASSAVPSKVT